MIPVLRGIVDATTSAERAAPLLVLGPSLGTTAQAWRPAAKALAATYRVVRFDLPGHGASPATRDSVTVAELAQAVVELVDSLGGGRFAYAGVSLGGAIGLELALGPAASRLDALVVICSGAQIGAPATWLTRADQVRQQGTASLVADSAKRWFSTTFPSREPEVCGQILSDLVEVDDESYARCCEALAHFDRRADLERVAPPTLVVGGAEDPVVPPEEVAALAESIPSAHSTVLPGVGHQAHVEAPGVVAALIRQTYPPSRYEEGLAIRRAVLGDSYVSATAANTTPDTESFQHFITEYAWGEVWGRPGLDRRLRSAITLASLVTAHHWRELELHLRAALRNGLTRQQIVEILLHTAVYAGVPAANRAFDVARGVFADLDASADDRPAE